MNSCKYYDCGWCYAPDDVETSASSQSACLDPDYCPYLKSQMTKEETLECEIKEYTLEIEQKAKEIGNLKDILDRKEQELKQMKETDISTVLIEGDTATIMGVKYKRIEEPKSPVEEAYKKVYGAYPPTTPSVSNFEDTRWSVFQAGYNASKVSETPQEPEDNEWTIEKLQEKNWYVDAKTLLKSKEPEENDWKTVALLFGKKLPVIPPYGYDELSPNGWYMWVVFNYDYYIKQRDIESGRYPTPPQTPEQIEKSLRTAFGKAQQTEKWKEIQKLIDEEDNDKNFKNSLDLIREWGEKNKPPTLYEILMEWWINHLDMEHSDEEIVDGLVNIIDKKFIPPSSDRNGYEWEKCLKMMRDKLR
jgi:hypothetical protein